MLITYFIVIESRITVIDFNLYIGTKFHIDVSFYVSGLGRYNQTRDRILTSYQVKNDRF